MTRTRCDNPTCQKVIPAINIEFGGPHVIVNFMDWGRIWYACGPDCQEAAYKAYDEDCRNPRPHTDKKHPMTRTRCDNPTCRKVIPAINLEFGGPHEIVNFMEGLDFGRTWYACGPACAKAARKAFEEDCRDPRTEDPWY